MFLSDLLDTPVLQGGSRIGFLNDVRLFLPEHTAGQQVGTPLVFGVVVCPRRASSFVGYERTGVNEPRALAAIFGWRTRGSFFVLWPDLLAWGDTGIELRPDAKRWSPALG